VSGNENASAYSDARDLAARYGLIDRNPAEPENLRDLVNCINGRFLPLVFPKRCTSSPREVAESLKINAVVLFAARILNITICDFVRFRSDRAIQGTVLSMAGVASA
jgi:hypothetical protein